MCVCVCDVSMCVCVQVLPLTRCHVGEYRESEVAELMYRAIKVDCDHGNEVESIILLSGSVNEKVEWMADLAQVRE